MSEEATEIRKQFTVYADAITAFGTAQLVAFAFLMAHGDCFTKNVLGGLWYAVGFGAIVNVAYLILVFLCHRGADRLVKHSAVVAPVLRAVRILRYAILTADLLATVFLPLAIKQGLHSGIFFIECKGT